MGFIIDDGSPLHIKQPLVTGDGNTFGLLVPLVSAVEVLLLSAAFDCALATLPAFPECLHHHDFRMNNQPGFITEPTQADTPLALVAIFRQYDCLMVMRQPACDLPPPDGIGRGLRGDD